MGPLDGLVGLFGREGDAIEFVREDVPELFLRRNHRCIDAALVLVSTAAGFLALGMYWFSRREYRDLT